MWDFPPFPFFLSRTILYGTRRFRVEKPLAQGKDKQELHVMQVFGGGAGGARDSLPFVIIINNDKADFSEKITMRSSELFTGFTLTLVLNFQALVRHPGLKECGKRKLGLQNPFRKQRLEIPFPAPSQILKSLSKLPASFL